MSPPIPELPSISALDTPSIHLRYHELRAQCSGDPENVSDDPKLREMVLLLRELRLRAVGPPKAKAPKATPTVEDL